MRLEGACIVKPAAFLRFRQRNPAGIGGSLYERRVKESSPALFRVCTIGSDLGLAGSLRFI
jgi:hypothetical protein